jgi:DnaK suppressor protein
MNQDSKRIKQLIELKLDEVTNPPGWRDSIAVRTTADLTDATQLTLERELATRGLSRNASLVRELRAALNRIADGSFGTCVDCEENIHPRRLNAVPWSPRCLACQEDLEAGTEYRELAA